MNARECKRCGTQLSPAGDLNGMCGRCLMELGFDSRGVVFTRSGEEVEVEVPDPEELAAHLEGYEILEVLGQGGMGVVYHARQKSLDRPVALKVLPMAADRDPTFAERFTREAQALASLGHPGIVSVFDFGRAGSHLYLAMEFVDGLNLRQLIRREPLSPRQALGLVAQISDSLQYAHDHGVVHRDIKPENVLVDRNGRAKLTDFGLAKLVTRPAAMNTLTATNQVMGTPVYMAPEQIERPFEVDHRADIYSLGVVLYELLTGELPIGHFTPPSEKVQVDVRLDEVVLKALAKEPRLRYQHAVDVKTDVDDISASKVARIAAASGRGAQRGGEKKEKAAGGRRSWAATILIVLFVIAGGFVAVAMLGALLVTGSSGSMEVVPAEMEQVARVDVLDGWEMVRDEDGKLVLAMPLIRKLDLQPAEVDVAQEVITQVQDEYLEQEQAHSRTRLTPGGRVVVDIDAFPERRRALERRVWQVLPNGLLPLERQRLIDELMPFGTGERVVLWEDEEGLHVEVADAGNPNEVVARGTFLEGSRFERLMVRVPNEPPSALRGAKLVLGVVDRMNAQGAESQTLFDVHQLKAQLRSRAGGEEYISVYLELTIFAENPTLAARASSELLEELRQHSWFQSYSLTKTAALKDGSGVQTGGFEIRVTPGETDTVPLGPLDTVRLSSMINEAGESLGRLNVRQSTRKLSRMFTDELFHVSPVRAKEQTRTRAQVVEVLDGMEALPGLVITALEIEPPSRLSASKRAPDEWLFDATLTARGRQ